MIKKALVLLLVTIVLVGYSSTALAKNEAQTIEIVYQAGSLVWQEGDPPGLEGFEFTFSWNGIACNSYKVTIVAEDAHRVLMEESNIFNKKTSSFDLVHMDRWASDAVDGKLWADTYVFTLELCDKKGRVVYSESRVQTWTLDF